MATHEDIGVSALFNTIGAIGFLLAFALLRIQPINDRVYFPKWYIVGKRTTPGSRGGAGGWGGFESQYLDLFHNSDLDASGSEDE